MSGELTTIFGGNKVTIKGGNAALAKAFDDDLQDSGDGQTGGGNLFLNFSGKSGLYSLGRAKDDMDPEEPFVVMNESHQRGWVFWRSNKIVKRHRWAVGSAGIAEEDLEDLEAKKEMDGWKAERAFLCKSLEDGKQVEFSTSTVSAVNAVADMIKSTGDMIKTGADATYPIVGFDKEQFTAHEQTNWKPKLVIMGWASMEQLVAYEAGELELDDLFADEEPEVEVVESKAKKKAAPKRRRPAL